MSKLILFEAVPTVISPQLAAVHQLHFHTATFYVLMNCQQD